MFFAPVALASKTQPLFVIYAKITLKIHETIELKTALKLKICAINQNEAMLTNVVHMPKKMYKIKLLYFLYNFFKTIIISPINHFFSTDPKYTCPKNKKIRSVEYSQRS